MGAEHKTLKEALRDLDDAIDAIIVRPVMHGLTRALDALVRFVEWVHSKV